jgi:hypothetical protein
VVEDVEPALLGGDSHLERFAGLGVPHGDREVVVSGVPEQADVDPVTGAAVEFARRRVDGGVWGV